MGPACGRQNSLQKTSIKNLNDYMPVIRGYTLSPFAVEGPEKSQKTGKSEFLPRFVPLAPLRGHSYSLLPDQFQKLLLIQHRHPELRGLLQLRSRAGAGHHVVRLLAD